MEMIFTTLITHFSGFWGQVELAGTVFSLLCVYLATKHNQWTWFFGALGVICFGALFYEYKLYSDAGLQILFFLPMQIWGFLYWRQIAAQTAMPTVTKSLELKSIVTITLAIAILTAVNGWLMFTYTDASFPFADAWTTWMSVFAQILMIRKYWQSWVLWFVMDIGAIYIYFVKGLFVTSGLYVVFLMIAFAGMVVWYHDWKRTQENMKEG